jgi:hypothetical protein
MKQLDIGEVTAEEIRGAAQRAEELVVFDGGEPVSRLVPVTAELARQEHYFLHYPHDPETCLHTCWRHPKAGKVLAETPARKGK